MSDAALRRTGPALRFDRGTAVPVRGRYAGRLRVRPVRRPGRARPRLALDGVVYLLAPVVAAIAVASWHTPGHFVAGGDIGPFVREGLARDVASLWGYGLTGAGSATAEIARLPELVVYEASTHAGLAPEVGQLVFFWIWLTGASAACIFLSRQLVASRAAHAAVGVLAVANPLMAVNLPNPLMPAALCVLGLLAGELLRVARGEGRVARTVLATLPISYLAINPPMLVVVAVAATVGVGAGCLFVPSSRNHLLRHAAFAAPLTLVAHGWWVVPTVTVLVGGPAVEAVTDPRAWSWTHVNNTLGNVATLTAHWGWGMHEYLPFTAELDQLPLSPLRWALPVLGIAAPAVAATERLRRAAVVIVGVALVCVLVAKGLHHPAGWFNLELYHRVPGMWLLREPMSKVGPVLLLAYLAGSAISVDGVLQRVRVGDRRRAIAGRAVLVALVASAVAFGHPVLTGGVAPRNRTPLPPSRVVVPAGWYELADAVNADPTDGKALVLPSLPYYQATTTWGFHGAATLPRDLLRRPTLLGLPGGYFGDDLVVSGLVNVVAGAADAAQLERSLDALGVSHVIVRTDLSDAQAVRPIAHPDGILRRLRQSGVFEVVDDFGVAVVFQRQPEQGGAAVFAEAASIAASTPGGVARAVASLPPGTAAVKRSVGVDISTSVFDGDTGRINTTVRVPESGRYELRATPARGTTALASRSAGGATVDARLALRVDGRSATTSQPLEIPGAGVGPVVALVVDGRPQLLEDQPVAVDLAPNTRLQALSESAAGPLPVRGWTRLSDCNAFDDSDAGLTATIEGDLIQLTARRHSACVSAAVPLSGRALLRFDAQVTRGPLARACLWSDSASTCVWERTLEPEEGWQHVADVVDVPADARLFLYADAGDGPAATSYRAVEVVDLVAGPAIDGTTSLPPVVRSLPAGEHVLELTQPSDQLLGARVGDASPVGNCNARDESAHLSATLHGGTVRLEATHDAACVYFPIRPVTSDVSYDIRFEYRTLAPNPARWCLWLDGPDRCANDVQVLEPEADWALHRERLVIPVDVTGVRLFVYADGAPERGSEPTVNEYRRPSVRAAAPITVRITKVSAGAGQPARPQAPMLGSAHGSGDRWELSVRGTGAPFLLALPDASDPGWALHGLPSGTVAEPTVVDGFRQAWVLTGLTGDVTLTARYGPAQHAHVARWSSVTAVVVIVSWWLTTRRRDRRQKPFPRHPAPRRTAPARPRLTDPRIDRR